MALEPEPWYGVTVTRHVAEHQPAEAYNVSTVCTRPWVRVEIFPLYFLFIRGRQWVYALFDRDIAEWLYYYFSERQNAWVPYNSTLNP